MTFALILNLVLDIKMNDVQYIQTLVRNGNQRVQLYESHIASTMYGADDIDALERKFDSAMDNLRQDVHQHTEAIGNAVKAKFPRPWAPDYYNQVQYFNALAQYACTQINYLEGNFDSTFSRLTNLFHRLGAWIRNKARHVYGAVKGFFRSAVNKVRSWFS